MKKEYKGIIIFAIVTIVYCFLADTIQYGYIDWDYTYHTIVIAELFAAVSALVVKFLDALKRFVEKLKEKKVVAKAKS